MDNMDNHPLSITAKEIHDLVGTDTPRMLEIGCHEGTDTTKFIEEMPDAFIVCFEPDVRPAARFRETHSLHTNVCLYHAAVGDVDGIVDFHASTGPAGDRDDWDFSGSLNKPTGHYQRSPEIAFMKPLSVLCMRLDTWMKTSNLAQTFLNFDHAYIDFIWADLQGGQRKFIAGAQEALKHIRFLYIECHTTPLYEGEPSHDELIALLPGFEPIAVYERENILFKNRSLQ